MSSFIQRTYDQLSQDLAMNKNPAVILVFWGGISEADETHLCTFDMAMMNGIPNLICLSPSTKQEYLAMLEGALSQNENPVVIRVPKCVINGVEVSKNWNALTKAEVLDQGKDVAILGLGNFVELGKNVAKALEEKGIKATLVNQRCSSDLDKNFLANLSKEHSVVVTLEDGALAGGFGEKVASFYGATDVKVLNFGALKEFTNREKLDSIYSRYNLTVEQIVSKVMDII
jgi:1-deoxy-D-xylulose-5-phosphate synthase